MPEVRLIDANALIKKICENECGSVCDEECENAACNFYDYIMDAPTIEPEVRHGRWIALEGWFNKSNVKCSICGNTLNMNGVNAGRGDANFCPNCGADMREVSKDAAD